MGCDEDTTNFDALLKHNSEPLYEGCTKYSKLSFMLKFVSYKLYVENEWQSNNHDSRVVKGCI